MNCNYCKSKMKDGVMLCYTNDYRINDNSGNLKVIIESHELESDDEEMGDNYPIKYCNCVGNPEIVSFVEVN